MRSLPLPAGGGLALRNDLLTKYPSLRQFHLAAIDLDPLLQRRIGNIHAVEAVVVRNRAPAASRWLAMHVYVRVPIDPRGLNDLVAIRVLAATAFLLGKPAGVGFCDRIVQTE